MGWTTSARFAVSGEAVLLDTNAFIYFLEGRARVAQHVLRAETVYYSVITEIELLSARHLTESDIEVIREFLSRCQRIELTAPVVELTIDIRRQRRIKTPDAIVAASALSLGVPLVTADGELARIPGLSTIVDILD